MKLVALTETLVPGRDSWNNRYLVNMPYGSCSFTDGSKLEDKKGPGLFVKDLISDISHCGSSSGSPSNHRL